MTFLEWIDKHVPEGKELLYLKKAGLTKNLIHLWRIRRCRPTCLPIIYLSMVIAIEQHKSYKETVLEGIKAGATNG